VRVLAEIGGVDVRTGQPHAAFGTLHRTLECAREAGVWKVWRYYPAVEDLAAALVAASTAEERGALAAAERELVTPELVQVLIGRGIRQSQQGQYPQALAVYRLAQAIAEPIGDKLGIATVLGNIGVVHRAQGNYEQALEFHQKSLAQFEALADKPGIATALMGIGNIHASQGSYAQALEFFQKSLTQREALGDQAGIATVLGNIGVVHKEQGNYAQALEFYQRSLTQLEALGDELSIATVLGNIGVVHAAQGNYGQALEFFQKSLSLKEALGDKAGIASTLGNIGVVHERQGSYGQALGFYQNSLTQFEALGAKAGIARMLGNIGELHRLQGNRGQALEFYQKSLTLNEALGDKAAMVRALGNIGVVYQAEGNYEQALDVFQKSLTLGEAIGALDIAYGSHWGIGIAHRAQGRVPDAIAAFQRAVTMIEELRSQAAGGEQEQQRFLEDKIRPYQALVEALIKQGRFHDAFAAAERAKARVLLDVLYSGRVNVTRSMTAAEQEKEQALRGRLVSANTQLSREKLRPEPDAPRVAALTAERQQARLEYEAFQTALYAAHPELKVKRGEAPPLTVEQAGALLPDETTALLEFVVTEEKSYLFVLTGEDGGRRGEGGGRRGATAPAGSRPSPSAAAPVSLRVYTLAIRGTELAALTERFRLQLSRPGRDFAPAARQLYDTLLRPAAAQLRGRTTLVIVPDGVLWELPFQAIQPHPNRFLLEEYTLSYAPSLSVLREMRKAGARLRAPGTRPGASPLLLAFGNPALLAPTVERVRLANRDAPLDPLPAAEREVKALGQLYGAARSRVYTGRSAREERAKSEAGQCRVLHLATHGILSDTSPMYSHVVLAGAGGDGGEDGLLEAWEMMGLELDAELVVLSACQTARGRVGAGEGMIGMAWALFVAGCPATVVSQWKVADASTSALMVAFHRQLKSRLTGGGGKGMSRAEALRQAALKLRKEQRTAHPFYWAPFVLVGDGR
jgi:CHAT domain-containing protein/Tfp pilus assembly protein PilF